MTWRATYARHYIEGIPKMPTGCPGRFLASRLGGPAAGASDTAAPHADPVFAAVLADAERIAAEEPALAACVRFDILRSVLTHIARHAIGCH
jgi:hypothetical protein